MSVCMYMCGSFQDRFVCVNKYNKGAEKQYQVKPVELEIFVYVRNCLKIDARDEKISAFLNPRPHPHALFVRNQMWGGWRVKAALQEKPVSGTGGGFLQHEQSDKNR